MTVVAAIPGWVYVLTNPSMPGLVKIGFTSRDPTRRAAELAQATGVPTPFVIAWCRAVADSPGIEAIVHRMLDDRRIAGREFFRCDVKTARQVIEAQPAAGLGGATVNPGHSRSCSGAPDTPTGAHDGAEAAIRCRPPWPSPASPSSS